MILRFFIGFVLVNASLQAEETKNLNGWYVGVSHGIYGTEPSSYFQGAESMSNTVGTGGVRTDVQIGYVTDERTYARKFLYVWSNDSAKRNEQGIGLGLKGGGFVSDNLAFTIGAKAGIGTQGVKGDAFMTQSGSSDVSFITGTSSMNPTPARFVQDTDVFEVGLLLDMDYFIVKNVNLNFGLAYIASFYSFSYEMSGGGFTTLSGVGQDNYQATLGLNVNF